MIKIKKIEVDAVQTYTCNNCAKDYPAELFTGIEEIGVTGHWESVVLSDATRYWFSICEHCLIKMFKSFKIKPKETEYM